MQNVWNAFSEEKSYQAPWEIVLSVKIEILSFDSVANWILLGKGHSQEMKSQMGTFHEVLPGNLVFFNFYYSGTIELEYLDKTTALNRKNYISTENFTFGIQNLS